MGAREAQLTSRRYKVELIAGGHSLGPTAGDMFVP
jgi:hypothetical protein